MVDEAQPQPARIHPLRQHEALVLGELERYGDLPGGERIEARGADDAVTARERRDLTRNLRQAAHATVRERRQLDAHHAALALRNVGDEAHRAVEDQRDIDLALLLGHLDYIDQAGGAAGRELRGSHARAEEEGEGERQRAAPALSA